MYLLLCISVTRALSLIFSYSSKTSNGPQHMDASPPVLRRKVSNTKRRSYIEAVGVGNELSRSNEEVRIVLICVQSKA